jgi:hypothetical protein
VIVGLSTFDTAFQRGVVTALQEALNQTINELAEGYAADFAEYRERVGKIAALRQALAICEEQLRKAMHG